jgi:hypothetical protein
MTEAQVRELAHLLPVWERWQKNGNGEIVARDREIVDRINRERGEKPLDHGCPNCIRRYFVHTMRIVEITIYQKDIEL